MYCQVRHRIPSSRSERGGPYCLLLSIRNLFGSIVGLSLSLEIEIPSIGDGLKGVPTIMASQFSCLILSLILLVLGTPFMVGAQSKAEDKEALYSIGVKIGGTFESLLLSEKELDLIIRGIRDQTLSGEVEEEPEEIKKKVRRLMEERQALWSQRRGKSNREVIRNAAKEKGAVTTASGLVYLELTEGAGASPQPQQQVMVHYHGTLADGSVFDSSVERGRPASFGLNRVIPCWTEGVQKMKVGGKTKLTCPPELAYGDKGQGGIPPGSVLTFEVELLDISD